jgi:hypothetical protein
MALAFTLVPGMADPPEGRSLHPGSTEDPTMTTQDLCRLFALVATGATLMADSTGPICASYKGFDYAFDYQLDCGGGDEGSFRVSMETLEGTGTNPSSADVVLTQESGAGSITVGQVLFSGDCTEEGEGTGKLSELILQVTLTSDTALLHDFTCSGWVAGETDQSLSCTPPDTTGVDACMLVLTQAE